MTDSPAAHTPGSGWASRVVVAGALHIDATARPTSPLIPGVSNTVEWQSSVGGVAANVARHLAVSCHTRLVSAVGEDSEPVVSALRAANVQTDCRIFPGVRTGRYHAILDNHGGLFVGLSDVALAERLRAEDILAAVQQHTAGILVLDANLNPGCLNDVFTQLPEPRPLIVALSVSPVKALRWATLGAAVDLLICNRAEAAALGAQPVDAPFSDQLAGLQGAGFTRFIVTDGDAAVSVADPDQTRLTPPPVPAISTVNGAGDAFAGAVIAAWSRGNSLPGSVREYGFAAASRVLQGLNPAPALE